MPKDFKLVERLDLGTLATYIPNKGLPVYSWFYYKEGFSRDLVTLLLDRFKPSSVLDPFCGVGTTMLACRERSINSLGFDALPVSVFASRVKTRSYNSQQIRKETLRLFEDKPRPASVSVKDPFLKRAFKRGILEDAFYFRNRILSLRNRDIGELFMLALMNAAMKCSYIWKDGSVLKIRKKPVPPLRLLFKRQLKKMAKDIEAFKGKGKAEARLGDARSLPLKPESFDAVITSPPYLNKIEYTKIYRVEQELFLDFVLPKTPVRSFIGFSLEKLEKDSLELARLMEPEAVDLPMEACSYFLDMYQAISEMHRVLKPQGSVGLVVGNGCFPSGVVESDIILSRIAEKIGFKVKKILVLSKRWCTRDRTKKVGIMRESLLVWEKQS